MKVRFWQRGDGQSKLRGEEHQPDVLILISVVALAAIGILMVYSSSAMKAYTQYDGDTFKIVGPQVIWALLGLVAMVVMMRVDYRWLRKVSVAPRPVNHWSTAGAVHGPRDSPRSSPLSVLP